MAEITARNIADANALSVAAKAIEGLRAKLAEERAARLKAEGERDEALVSVSELRLLHQETERVNQILRERVADAERFSERDQRERRAALTGREAAEARLRAVIEAADRVLTTLEPHFSPGDERQRDAILAYRRVRDAHASPEPECPAFSSVEDGDYCNRCGLPWSQHGGRDGE